MKKRSLAWFLVFAIFFCFNATVIAKEEKSSTSGEKKAPYEKTEDATPVVPFDINAEKLPPAYKGNDIAELYSGFIKEAPLKKEEFETTAEYEKKIASVMADMADAIYAFKLDTYPHSQIHPYDADANKLKIDLETESQTLRTVSRAYIIVKEMDMGSDSYIGSNAFGATRLVKRYTGTQYGIALVNQKDFGRGTHRGTYDPHSRTVNIEIDMPIDKAKQLKDNIGILLLCKPSLYKLNTEMKYIGSENDLIFEDNYYAGATIDIPISFFYARKFINVEVLTIWIYDFRTGEIILKKQLKEI